jgi:glycosyltransferase involved in cell wall biosynthesis
MARTIRTLLYSTLYPSSARPVHGIFVETRLRELLRTGEIETKVLAPVPWFPSADARWGEWARMSATPSREIRNGIDVLHTRYLVVPKIGMTVAPLLLAAASIGPMRRLITEGFDFDLIDAHYFYPDGVAAALLAQWTGKPFVVTARGSDVNLIGQYAVPRRLMRWAGSQAAACIAVSSALADALGTLGIVPTAQVQVMRNGVDLERFLPVPQAEARAAIAQQGAPLLLSVGNLVPLKGHSLCVDALALLQSAYPQARLVIAGEGPLQAALAQQVRALGLESRVALVGRVDNDQLASWYSAADLLLHPSSREGLPNVLLESLACGTPVVATRVGGIPEVIRERLAGTLIAERSARSLADAVAQRLAAPQPERATVRLYAAAVGWESTSRMQETLFRTVLSRQEQAAHA